MYQKQQWEDLPSQLTALAASRLNHLETQYDEAVVYTDEKAVAFQAAVQLLIDGVAGATIADPAHRYRVVACALRNTGSGWSLIQDAGHEPIGISGVDINGDFVRLTYDFTASRVGALQVTPDETFAVTGIRAGASVGLSSANIQLAKVGGNNDYVSWNGTAWVSSTGFVTGTTMNATSGLIRFTHEDVSETLAGAVGLRSDGANRVLQGGMGATSIDATVFPYNSATSLKAPTTDLRFFVSRPGARKLAPAAVVSASGNLWVSGVFEVDG